MKPFILVVCTGNSMRSQMAEGLLRHDLGEFIDVDSAGTHPSGVHPFAINTMKNIGIDISGQKSKSVEKFMDREVDLVITVCDHAREVCPIFPFAQKTVHVGYPDPIRAAEGRTIEETFAELRDQMRAELEEVVIRELDLNVD